MGDIMEAIKGTDSFKNLMYRFATLKDEELSIAKIVHERCNTFHEDQPEENQTLTLKNQCSTSEHSSVEFYRFHEARRGRRLIDPLNGRRSRYRVLGQCVSLQSSHQTERRLRVEAVEGVSYQIQTCFLHIPEKLNSTQLSRPSKRHLNHFSKISHATTFLAEELLEDLSGFTS